MSDQRLGRGLKYLFSGSTTSNPDAEIEVDLIAPNRLQPRKQFDVAAMGELISSVRRHGILQPLLVRRMGEGRYELIAGERRLRAAKEAGLTKVPVTFRDNASDRDVLELAIIENVQRADLDAIEKAKGYRQLIGQFSLTQEQVAERIGQDRSTIANHLRLLDLPEEVQAAVSRGTISMGHARALLGLSSKEAQLKLLRRIEQKGLSVRDVEALAREGGGLLILASPKRRRKASGRPLWLDDLEMTLQKTLSAKVRIHRGGSGRGLISIEFASDAELERLYTRIKSGAGMERKVGDPIPRPASP